MEYKSRTWSNQTQEEPKREIKMNRQQRRQQAKQVLKQFGCRKNLIEYIEAKQLEEQQRATIKLVQDQLKQTIVKENVGDFAEILEPTTETE